jgi:hypothetical protein
VAAACGGATALICVSLRTVNDSALTVPKVTFCAAVKPEPLMTTLVPPAVLPVVVPRLLMTGSAASVTL